MKSEEAKWEPQILLICFGELEYYGMLQMLTDAQKDSLWRPTIQL